MVHQSHTWLGNMSITNPAPVLSRFKKKKFVKLWHWVLQ